jgi:hypothetical protein
MRRQSPYLPVLVVENLTWRQFALLNVLAPQLSGMRTDVGSFRIYNTPRPRRMSWAMSVLARAVRWTRTQ